MDTAMARHGYSDASFLYHRILHQKVRNVQNLCGKIRAFVLVMAHRSRDFIIPYLHHLAEPNIVISSEVH